MCSSSAASAIEATAAATVRMATGRLLAGGLLWSASAEVGCCPLLRQGSPAQAQAEARWLCCPRLAGFVRMANKEAAEAACHSVKEVGRGFIAFAGSSA